MAHDKLRTFHLFAGAGGGILADLLLGHIPVGACEIEEYPRKVLLQRQRDGILPMFPIWDDIRTLDGKPWRGLVDVVCGGFPCQDISAAGKGAGIEGGRSGLWSEMARVVREIRPRFVFVENSPLLVGRGLAVVLGDLAKTGYDARWCVLGGSDVDAPSNGERLWVFASSIGIGLENNRDGSCCKKIYRAESWPDSFTSISPEKWLLATASATFRGGDGVANRVDRFKAIGNGQVPQVAALAWTTLAER